MKRASSHINPLIVLFILFATNLVFGSDTLLIQKQYRSVLADAFATADEGKFLVSYSPCGRIEDFVCNDILNTGNSLFSDLSETTAELKRFNTTQSNTILWIFSGRFYFKYSELQATQNLSEDELVEIIPPSGQSLIVRPEEMQNKVYSMQALGLNTLGSDVLNIVKQRHPGKKILILFITESFIASPEFNIDGTTKQINVEALSFTQKNIFFKQFGLEQETKTRLNQTFHRSYLDELDKLDNTNDTGKRNKWLASTTKDLIAVLGNNAQAFAALPSSPRERAYAYALERAQFNPGNIVGYDEFKPGGYRYNYNALYNAKGYFESANGQGVVAGPPIDGVSCPPNYIWNGTTAISGIININANEPPCSRVSEDKLIQHFLQRGQDYLPEQIGNAIEFSLVLEAALALRNQTTLQTKVFQARRDLLLHIAQMGGSGDQQAFVGYTTGPLILDNNALRQTPKDIVRNLRPVNPGGPTISPLVLRVTVIMAAAAAIIAESIEEGHNSYMANRSIDLLFKLYKAFDDASFVYDFDVLKEYRITDIDYNSDEELLRQLKYIYDNDQESMTDGQINVYFLLLCQLEGICAPFNPLKYEKHHIIPQERSTHPLVVAARSCSDKFYFNGEDNLILLEKYDATNRTGRHGNHPKYNDWVTILLDEALGEYEQDNNGTSPDPCKAKEILKRLIEELLQVINSSNKPLNQIGEEQLRLLGK